MKIYICDDMIEMVEAVKAECEHYLQAKNMEAQVAGDVFFVFCLASFCSHMNPFQFPLNFFLA